MLRAKLRLLSPFAILVVLLAAWHAPAQVSHANIAAACMKCHASQALTQPQTPMGRALQMPYDDPTLAAHPKLKFQKWGYTYVVQTQEGQSTYSVTDGKQTITLPIEWNFGEGGQTWMFKRGENYYESLVSYYPAISGLAVTVGDEKLVPTNLDEAVGRKLKPSEPKDCFGCHSSNAVYNGQLDLQSMEPGVNCAHCHTGAMEHLVGAIQGQGLETAPPDLRKLSSEDISNFCGQCHRSWETVIRSGLRGVLNVRFQPYRLANSKCFDGSDPRISCIACHDPHRKLVTDDAWYDSKCLACHASKNMPPQTASQFEGKACPVATSNCVNCHMPKVKLPNGLMTFHDHLIRVVKPGSPYPD
jgi:Cytochrome c554 and c-prime